MSGTGDEERARREPGSMSASGGSMIIGSMTNGAAAVGSGATAVNGPVSGSAVGRGARLQSAAADELLRVPEELLQQMAALRAQLALLAPDQEGVSEVAGALREIEESGQGERGRLERLIRWLSPGGSAAAVLGAAATVSQALSELLG
ncbi:hypothetical protein [Streptomyces sp. NPDC006879]|uniref:hypothetical protein n=1 Tax=Streptomyces sp. NPDC006879 TaxID=3364767 RepID=UPI0036CB0401